MKQQHDRRDFLKLFGLSSAAVAIAEGSASEIEMVSAPSPVPLPIVSQTAAFMKQSPHNTYDVRDEPLYSVVHTERNAMKEDYRFFACSGQDTLAETNLCQSNRLMNPEAYCVKQIGFVFSPLTLPALRSAFIDRYALSVGVGRKPYFTAPLALLFSVADVEPDRENGFAKFPDEGFVKLEIPLIFAPGVYFWAQLIGKPIHPCGKLTGWAVFKGLHCVGIC
jgi:hypothetical protein